MDLEPRNGRNRSPGVAAGIERLTARIARLPGLLRAFAATAIEPMPVDPDAVRCFILTGVGSSAAHARFLAHLLTTELGLAARFVPLSALASGTLRQTADDVLIVFSQGLSPNARLALRRPAAWQRVLLATAVTDAGSQRPGQAERRLVLDRLREAGGAVFRFPEEDEFETLVRVSGPLCGYLCALRMAQALAARRRHRPVPSTLAIDIDRICAEVSDGEARLGAALGGLDRRTLGEPLAFLTSGEYGELTANLGYKVLEGVLAPLPPVWDLLHFAHGPFQQIYEHRQLLVALTRPDAPIEATLLTRLAQLLVPGRHQLIQLPAQLPGALAIFAHEALLNHWMLGAIVARQIDQVDWPGRGYDGPLYDFADAGSDGNSQVLSLPPPPRMQNRLAMLHWPQLAVRLAGGQTTAVLPLGALEQHGPHLPFATDTLIADAVAQRLCARLPDAVQLPTVPIGCSAEHLDFPGTLHLRSATLGAILLDIAATCRQHGYRRLFVFTAHGGNYGPLADWLLLLRAACAPLELVLFLDSARLTAACHAASAAYGVSAEDSGHHAGEFETSILQELWPESVASTQLQAGLVRPLPTPSDIFYPSLRPHSESGTVGDPRAAGLGRAEHYLAVWVDILLDAYRTATGA